MPDQGAMYRVQPSDVAAARAFILAETSALGSLLPQDSLEWPGVIERVLETAWVVAGPGQPLALLAVEKQTAPNGNIRGIVVRLAACGGYGLGESGEGVAALRRLVNWTVQRAGAVPWVVDFLLVRGRPWLEEVFAAPEFQPVPGAQLDHARLGFFR